MTPEEERAFTERVLTEVRKALDEWTAEFTKAFTENLRGGES